jgi:hypothetical protein
VVGASGLREAEDVVPGGTVTPSSPSPVAAAASRDRPAGLDALPVRFLML